MKHHLLSISETITQHKTRSEGLSEKEAQERLLENGKNELVKKKQKSVFIFFLNQFKDVMILILLAAAAISIAIGELKDAIIILVIVVLNAIIGFIQEYRAEKAIEALKKMAALNAMVRRHGKLVEVPSSDLVLGDVVVLEVGNIVPADLRLIETHSLKLEESSLTGESSTVDKTIEPLVDEAMPLGDRTNMAFKSTVVSYGRGEGIVVAAGMQTEVGRIATLLQEEGSQTPLQKRLAAFSKILSFIVVGICIVLFGVGILRGEEPLSMLLTSISLAVAAIPEALTAVITISLALGAKRMVKQNALIRRLPSVETLGSINYICTDKTGTITHNRMTVTDIWQPNSLEPFHCLEPKAFLMLGIELNHNVTSSSIDELQGDPTEVALVNYTRAQEDYFEAWKQTKRIEELPFDSDRKLMTTIHPFEDAFISITKGALESVLPCCKKSNDAEIEPIVNEFAQEGKRVIAYAYRKFAALPDELTIGNIEQDLHFLGLVAMIDPPRPEAKKAIEDCHTAGITAVMITGDHPLTAEAIAKEAGILREPSDKVITGVALAAYSEEAFEKEVENIKVYARVSPEQKLQIVKMLQKKHHYVAMTGDGVNDAPALRAANIGVAMGISGTDVSKEAAQMILLDDNFATIIKAVKEGRRIFDNIRKFIKYILAGNAGEILTLFLAPLLGFPIPLLPIHILWINLVTDGLPALAFAAEPADDTILKRPPRNPKESIFSKGIGIHVLWVGFLIGFVCILTQGLALFFQSDNAQTMVFTVLAFSQLGHGLAIRSETKSLFQQGIFGNKQLIGAVLFTVVLQMAVIYVPYLQDIFRTKTLSLNELLLCIGLSSIVFWAVELQKWIKRRKGNL